LGGKLYYGITLKLNYEEEEYLDFSMPGYVRKQLKKYKHPHPQRLQHSPYAIPQGNKAKQSRNCHMKIPPRSECIACVVGSLHPNLWLLIFPCEKLILLKFYGRGSLEECSISNSPDISSQCLIFTVY